MNPTGAILQFHGLSEVHRLGWVLVHFLWQGAGIGLLVFLAMACTRSAAARFRYLICCFALLACAFAPVFTWIVLEPREMPRPATQVVPERTAEPVALIQPAVAVSPASGAKAEPNAPTPAAARAGLKRRFEGLPMLDSCLPYAVAFWFAGVTLLAARLFLGWLKLSGLRRSGRIVDHSQWPERLRRLAERIGVSSPVRLCQSALVEVPMLIGWLRPVILVPASVFTGLTPAQLEAVLAHELAHIRRHDYLVNILQSAIETVLFYHPAVWWISARIREERENCCDDIAVELTRDRGLYASALMLMEETRPGSAPLALAIAQGPLLTRIRRIAGLEKQRNPFAPALVAALIVSGVLLRALNISQPIHAADLNARPLLDENASHSSAPIADWQVAGIRASFGDSRQPFVESSSSVQREALKLAARRDWGNALAPEEVAVYLGSEDVSMRLAALRALGQMKKAGAPYAKQIAELVGDQRREIRYAAIADLVGLGGDGAPFAGEIAKHREGIDPWIRISALMALGALGRTFPEDAKSLVMDLAEVFFSRQKTNDGQGNLIPVCAALKEALSKRDTSFEAKSAATLLHDPEVRVRYAAATVLGKLGEQSSGAYANQLAALLTDGDPRVCCAAIEALTAIGPAGHAQAKQIAGLLSSPERAVRRAALDALGYMGEEGAAFAPQIAGLLKSSDDRNLAAATLGRMGAAGAVYADALVEGLAVNDSAGNAEVVIALGRMGRNDEAIAKKIVPLLANSDPYVREEAVRALNLMGRNVEACHDQFVAMVKEGDGGVRHAVAEVLRHQAENNGVTAAEIANDDWADVVDAMLIKKMLTSEVPQSGGPTNAAHPDEPIDFGGRGPALELGVSIGRVRSFNFYDGKPNRPHGFDGFLSGNGSPAANNNSHSPEAIYSDATQHGASVADRLAALLFGRDSMISADAYAFLDQNGNAGGDPRLQTALLAVAYAAPAEKIPEVRAHLRLWSGGNADMQRSVTWLGKPDMEPMPKEGLSKEELRAVLSLFLELWDPAKGSAPLREELVKRITQVANGIGGPPDADTAKVLNELAAKLEKEPEFGTTFDAIRRELNR